MGYHSGISNKCKTCLKDCVSMQWTRPCKVEETMKERPLVWGRKSGEKLNLKHTCTPSHGMCMFSFTCLRKAWPSGADKILQRMTPVWQLGVAGLQEIGGWRLVSRSLQPIKAGHISRQPKRPVVDGYTTLSGQPTQNTPTHKMYSFA